MSHRTFTLAEAARYLHVSAANLETRVRHGEIPCERPGGRIVFRKQLLDEWASQRIMGMSAPRLAGYHRHAADQISRVAPDADPALASLLAPEFVIPALASRTKAGVIRDLAARAEATGLVNDPADLRQSLLAREDLCSTGLPGGFALLHPRHHDPWLFERSFLMLARTPHPLPFGAPDGGETDVFFLVCCNDDRIHLHVLARICLVCSRTVLLDDLRAGAGVDSMFAALCAAEAQILEAKPKGRDLENDSSWE